MSKDVKIEESNFEELDEIDEFDDFSDIDELDDFGDIADLDFVEELDEFDDIDDLSNPKDSSVGFQKLDPSEYLQKLFYINNFDILEKKYPSIEKVFTADKIKALKQVKEDGLKLENLSVFQNDRDVVGIAIINNPDAFVYANFSAQEERIFILEICKEISLINLGFIPKSLLSDKDFMIELIQIKPYSFVHASKDLQNDKETVLVVVSLFGSYLEYASKELRSDREVVFAAIVNMGEAIIFASDELKTDKKFILKAIKARIIENRYLQHEGIFYCLSKELRDDEDIVLTSIKYDYMTIAYASDKYTTNREIVLEAVKFGGALQFVKEEFLDDKEIVLKAVNDFGHKYSYASKRLQLDKDIILAYINASDFCIHRFNNEAQNKLDPLHKDVLIDKEIALSLVSKDGEYLAYLEDFQNDKEVVIEGMKNNRLCLKYASDELKNDKDLLVAFEKSKN